MDQAPADVLNAGYTIFLVLGAGVLLPWNAFISGVDYFDSIYPRSHMDRVFGVAYMFPAFGSLLLLTFQHHRLRFLTAPLRINAGLALYLAMMLLVPLMDGLFRPSSWTHRVTVAAVALTGVADALVQGSLVACAGQLPGRYMQAFVAGTAASGVVASCLRITTKAALPSSLAGLRHSANLYFICSVIFMVICLVCYNFVNALPVIRYHLRQQQQQQQQQKDEQPLLLLEQGLPSLCDQSLAAVWRQTKGVMLSLCLVYVVTLSIFPGSITEDVHSRLLGDWYPVLLIACYNVCDLIGKVLTATYLPKSTQPVVWGSLARLLFFPGFALCLHGPAVLASEVSIFAVTSLLGLTNGYLTSALMIKAPKLVDPAQAHTAGLMSVLFLMAGLTLGSVAGWTWVL